MERQGLREALKVELQCHQKLVAQMKQDPQDGELKKQLHERQTRITSLSEKQKLGVRTCPVGATKPLSLVKPPGQNIAISVLPVKAPVSMVTAHINGQKAVGSEPSQTSPINLQTAGRVAMAPGGVLSLSRRAGELPHSQMLGTLTAVPIKVPQVSSLHRLAGQAPTVLPQVRPKTQIPDSLPHSPCQELQPLSLQPRVTAVISPKSQGAALPTANSTFSPTEHQRPNGQGDSLPPQASAQDLSGVPQPVAVIATGPAAQVGSVGPGVAYALITASPSAGNGASAGIGEAVKVQPLLFSADTKVIIIQPQVPSSTQGSPGTLADVPSREATPAPSPPAPAAKKDEDPEKIAFMVALGLVTTDQLEEIQTKRQERKRRSTANPAYSGLFEPERKRLPSNYLNNPLFLSARDSEDLCWKDDLEHDDHCAVCKEDGELQPCHNCTRAFHPDCLQPPLKTPPRGVWYCPKCQKKVLNKENMSWPQNFVQSYVTHKTVRQEEKRRLLRRNTELKKECSHLEEQDKRLSNTLAQCMDVRERLLGQQRDTQASLERLKALIRLIQRDQVIQVTMTATTTAGASLLSLPWIKPASTPTSTSTSTSTTTTAGPPVLLQKSQPQAQGNN